MKKSQISQVFTYMIIIIVVGVVVVLGYRGIGWIMQSQCSSQKALFEKSLFGFLGEYTEKGSVHEETIKAPCDVVKLCFADSIFYDDPSAPYDAYDGLIDPVILSALEDRKDNVFVVTKSNFTEPIGFASQVYVSQVEPHPRAACFNVSAGQFKLLFTGLGRKVLVSE